MMNIKAAKALYAAQAIQIKDFESNMVYHFK
jgi:hypothetical protein